MLTTRRPKWHPPPPPSPRILHLPRRIRRKPTKQITGSGKPLSVKESDSCRNPRGKLEALFGQERAFSSTAPIVLLKSEDCERRERVEDFECGKNVGEDFEEEKWKFQAEILRAECNFLRMEREIALKKLELNRVQTKRTLRAAVETLISGRKKIHEGKSIGVVLEEEIEDLAEKLEQLQRSSGVRDFEFQKCSNFDKQASVLGRRLEKLGVVSEEKCVREIREMAEASLTINTSCRFDESSVSDRKNRFTDVEILGKKMEGLSKGMLERMEEVYGSMLSSATSSASSSARIHIPDSFSSPLILQHSQETMFRQEKACSGRCKAIVRKIVEQVRAETEQWSQMQEMLGQVREEMEELQASRDFWQDRALHSDHSIQSLQSSVDDWRHKARSSESKVTDLQKQISDLRVELERSSTRTKGLPPLPASAGDSQKEKEKRVLICRLKENHQKQSHDRDEGRRRVRGCDSGVVGPKRSPLGELGNSSALHRQSSRAVFPLYCHEQRKAFEVEFERSLENWDESL